MLYLDVTLHRRLAIPLNRLAHILLHPDAFLVCHAQESCGIGVAVPGEALNVLEIFLAEAG